MIIDPNSATPAQNSALENQQRIRSSLLKLGPSNRPEAGSANAPKPEPESVRSPTARPKDGEAGAGGTEDRIRDTGNASQSAQRTLTQILNGSSTAMLAQANLLPRGVMGLL